MNATPDNTLADPEQIIADLRRQLAECKAERDQGLQRETAAAEVLQLINSSPDDLTPVFDAILEKAHSLCGAPLGSLVLRDGDQLRAVATRGYPQEYERLARQGFPPTPSFRLFVSGEPFVHVLDGSQPPTAFEDHPMRRASAEIAGVRTVLFVPLRKDETVLGYISAQRQEVRSFTDHQIALLESFAAQAVIAMENARLLRELRTRTGDLQEALEYETATSDVLKVISRSAFDLQPVLETLLKTAARLCDADAAGISSREGDKYRVVATFSQRPAFDTFIQGQSFTANRASVTGRTVLEGHIVHIADLTADPEYAVTEAVTLGGVRTGLGVPLLREGEVAGVIILGRFRVEPFTDRQIELVSTFADQAVIAIENTRLLTEQQEALEQQTATADVLQVINASPGDLGPVFDSMLEKAMRLCGAAFGSFYTYDGEQFLVAAQRGLPEAFAEFRTQTPLKPVPGSQLARAIENRQTLQVLDVKAEDLYLEGNPFVRAMVELGGVRTILVVPLCKDEVVLGFLSVYRQEVQAFSDKQIVLLQNFAAQAVIAMENARLLTETREALEQQTATSEVLQVINASPGDLKPVFDAMLERAIRLCESAFGILSTYDGECIHTAASRGATPALADFLREPIRPRPGMGLYRLVNGEDTVHVADITDDKTYRLGAPGPKALADLGGARAVLLVALRKDGALLGAINIFRQEVRPFSDKQIALLQNFAAQAVIAMENARLIAEQREALEQQTATAEVLQVINSSPGDLQPVFEAILEKAHNLCGVASGALQLYDGGNFRAVATNGLPEPLAKWLRDGWPPGSSQQRVVAGEADIIHIADLAASDSPRARYVADIGGVRTLLYVALRKDQRLLGVISASRFEVRPFSEKEIALLQNFAAQAVIAMENARLLGELRQRTDEVAELNRGLEARVAEQVEELGRVGRLKRFLAPQLAELIVSQGNEQILESHRREIVVVFCDLRGYTAFAETAEPEEVLDFLGEYHGALGPLVSQFEGTLDQFSGDGIMVFFNDPVPIPDPAVRAVKMAMAMREAASKLIAAWRRRGRVLGFGVGIAQGYATLGQIGFADRSGYTAIGTVCNLAARLCAEAKDGQILVAQRVAVSVETTTPLEEVGELTFKGLTQPVVAHNVPLAATQPALRVIERGPQSI